ncbi:MAG TPA: PHP-associated domain-containing protein [Myxococcota bacterium]|nr:PHP-associated domain-containing protein [Myxococcota bacterium]
MILDLHNHSIASDDGRARVENYCQWIRKRGLPLDGFVLSEHRQFDAASDYGALEREYDLVILKASEVETDYGHVLVFGVNDEMQRAFDFGRIDLPLGVVLEAADRCGGIAVPCHPGRPRVGMCAHFESKGPVEGVRVIETRNGGSRAREDESALHLAEVRGYRGIGGSDAHIVSHIGRCATRFPAPIHGMGELVEALRAGGFEAISWKSTSTS